MKISILIPARGECIYLPEALDSVRKSQIQPDEVLLIDDGLLA